MLDEQPKDCFMTPMTSRIQKVLTIVLIKLSADVDTVLDKCSNDIFLTLLVTNTGDTVAGFSTRIDISVMLQKLPNDFLMSTRSGFSKSIFLFIVDSVHLGAPFDERIDDSLVSTCYRFNEWEPKLFIANIHISTIVEQCMREFGSNSPLVRNLWSIYARISLSMIPVWTATIWLYKLVRPRTKAISDSLRLVTSR